MSKKNYVKTFTCFLTGNSQTYQTEMTCVENNNTNEDKEKIVRKYMHPTDNIDLTLWVFDAKIKKLMYWENDNKNGINNNEKLWTTQIKKEEQFNGKINFEKL